VGLVEGGGMIRVHIAGEIEDGVQRCTRCGEILIDYRGTMVMIMPDGTIPVLSGWQDGCFVAVDGSYSGVQDHDARDPFEMACTERVQ